MTIALLKLKIHLQWLILSMLPMFTELSPHWYRRLYRNLVPFHDELVTVGYAKELTPEQLEMLDNALKDLFRKSLIKGRDL